MSTEHLTLEKQIEYATWGEYLLQVKAAEKRMNEMEEAMRNGKIEIHPPLPSYMQPQQHDVIFGASNYREFIHYIEMPLPEITWRDRARWKIAKFIYWLSSKIGKEND